MTKLGTLAQAHEYLDGIRQWVSDGQSFLEHRT